VKVSEAMAKTISTASPNDEIQQVANLMKREGIGFIPITEGGSLVGVVTDRDIVVRCLAEGHEALHETAQHVMTSTGLCTVKPDDDLEKAAAMMREREVRRLGVVADGGRLIGVLSHGNLVQAMHGEGCAKEATVGVTRGA